MLTSNLVTLWGILGALGFTDPLNSLGKLVRGP